MSNQQIETQSSSRLDNHKVLLESFFQSEIFLLISTFTLLILFQLLMGANKKGIIANARFGGRIEKFNALKTAQKQREKGDKAKTALYLGDKQMEGWKPSVETLLTGNPPCLPLPNLNQHVLILGSTGCGKTTTVGNRAIQDVIRQGHPLIISDPKGELGAINAPYAEAHGYEIYFLAPGKAYTDRFNIVEWMRSSRDSTRAQQIAQTIQANAKPKGVAKTNDFFSDSGEVLIRSALMLTKESNYPDLLMAKRILALPELCQRIQDSYKSGRINTWIENSFQQFMAGKEAGKTIAGIAATAGLVFDKFTQEEFFNAFIGRSTIPMEFTGKKILFVQPPMDQEDVVMPVLTTAVEILIEENMSKFRLEPLILILEELDVGYWRKLQRWMSFRRSNGLAVILIAQLWSQIRDKYGQDQALAIRANANTQIYFNSNDPETAKIVSNRCGQKEVKVKQHSSSRGKQGNSNSTSEQLQKVPLKSEEELLKVSEGEFTMFSLGYASRGEVNVPIHMKYEIPQEILDRDKTMEEEVWPEYICPKKCKEVKKWHLNEEQREAALIERAQAAEAYLPLKSSVEEQNTDFNKTERGILTNKKEGFMSHV